MDTKTGFLNFRHMGISTKTSLISGIVVVLLLATTAVVILAMESRMIGYIIESFTQKETAALQADAEQEKKALAQRHQINTKICAGLSASFVYNFEQEGLKKSIETFLSLPDLSAIVVTDAEGKPFSALWKEGGGDFSRGQTPRLGCAG